MTGAHTGGMTYPTPWKHVEMRILLKVVMPESGELTLSGDPGETILIVQLTGDPTQAPLAAALAVSVKEDQ